MKRSSLLLEFMGSYLAELSLLDYSCLRFLPSVVAASSIFIARLTIGPDTNLWGKEMHKLTGYRASELKGCIIAIHDLQLNRKGPLLPAIRDKYKQHRFKCVSMLLPPVEIPTSYFQDLTLAHLDRSTIKLITPSSSRAPCDKGELQFQSRFSDKLE